LVDFITSNSVTPNTDALGSESNTPDLQVAQNRRNVARTIERTDSEQVSQDGN